MQTNVRNNTQQEANAQRRSIHPVKAYLQDYTALRRDLYAHIREYETQQRNLDRIDRLYERATKATSTMNAVRVSGTSMHDSMAEAVMEIIDLKNAMGKAVKEGAPFDCLMQDALYLSNECAMRLDLIARISETPAAAHDEKRAEWRELLFHRYIQGMGWDAIEREMKVPIRTLFFHHGKALNYLLRYYTPKKV